MNVLVCGGTRLIGKHLVYNLIKNKHKVTIATRGITPDNFGNDVERVIVERTNTENIKKFFTEKNYDIIYDSLAFSSNDVKCLLDVVKCKKYIMTSSISVYEKYKIGMKENEFEPEKHSLKWCWRNDDTYNEVKRQAECALFQIYNNIPSIAIRFPYVVGEDDYTKRLYFYVEHIVKGIPMYVNNIDEEMSFIKSDEAGKFLAFLIDSNYCGKINASSYGTIKIREIIKFIEEKAGIIAKYSKDGTIAPYNDTKTHSMNLQKAEKLGFKFSDLNTWIFHLIETYINQLNNGKY